MAFRSIDSTCGCRDLRQKIKCRRLSYLYLTEGIFDEMTFG